MPPPNFHINRKPKVVTPAAVALFSLDAIKTHLRISGSEDDEWLTAAIAVATQAAEEFTGLAFVNRTLDQTMDYLQEISDAWWDGVREAPDVTIIKSEIELVVAPLFSVTSVTTYDDSDAGTVFASTNYFVDTSDGRNPGRIVLKRGCTWPTGLRPMNRFVIRYVAGFGAAATDVPAPIILAVKNLVSYLYQNRGDCSCDCAGASGCMIPCGAAMLLNSFCKMRS